jgi:hypothetical protein
MIHFPQLKTKKVSYRAAEVDTNTDDVNTSRRTPACTVPDWPTEPRRVVIAPWWVLVDLSFLVIPVAFISEHFQVHCPPVIPDFHLALAIIAYKLDGTQVSQRGGKIQQAILLGPTIFPLGFAALGGRTLKKVALWRAQEGTTLGVITPSHLPKVF